MDAFNLVCEYYDNSKHIRSYVKDFYTPEKLIEKYDSLTHDKDIVSIKVVFHNDNVTKMIPIEDIRNNTYKNM